MVNPRFLCRNHLLGEHHELHYLHNWLKEKKQIDGWIKTDCLEPLSIFDRHDVLVREMERRQYKHKSPLNTGIVFGLFTHLPNESFWHKINREQSLQLLKDRCQECKKRIDYYELN